MAEPAYKIEETIIDPTAHIVSGVNYPQMADFGDWLANRAANHFPFGYQPAHVFGWLRSICGTNGTGSFHFVCTKGAVGLFEHRADTMVIKPRVIDHFVFIKEGVDVSEGQALYLNAKRWANSLGATEIQINQKSDVPLKMIEEVLGKATKREVLIAKVGK